MALCLAESLVERRSFDPHDQLERYVRWYRDGYLSSTGTCFDIGNATRAALERFERTGAAFPGDGDREAGGNGPLMKLAPVPMAYAEETQRAVELAALSARTTHGHPEAIEATRHLAADLVSLLDGVRPQYGAHGQVGGHAFAPRSLAAARWAFDTTDSYAAAVLAAANLGDDADTTAAIAGQLAGAWYGATGIREDWLEKLVMRERITELADGLFELSRHAPGIAPAARRELDLPNELPGDAYWVIEGKLLAGPYPGDRSKAQARRRLEEFLESGVTCFLDLTEEGEGPPLNPYSRLLRKIASERGVHVTHVRMPIRDVDVPEPWLMRAIQQTIEHALDAGELVYVHCWGGVGRTGTVVGCLLIERGCPASEVVERIKQLRTGTLRAQRASPETGAQVEFLRAWAPSS
jgi:ADP-ribosyl-[dinitrogen reductase] hydrolase